MKTIGIANQKGGVAKTTTAKETAALLAANGWRVVAVDLDGQADLTSFFLEDQAPETAVSDVLAGSIDTLSAVVAATGREHLDLLPADDRAYLMGQGVTAEAMRGLVADLAGSYDYAVIDFPRVVSPATIAALAACDVVVVPTEASRASADAAAATLDTLESIGGGTRAAVLITRYNGRTTISREYADLIEGLAAERGARVYRARVSLATAVPEAEGYGMTLSEHKPRSRPAQDYRDYLLELLSDLAIS